MRKCYKIRRKSDGLFSTGGAFPDFTKQGKAWSAMGHLKNHLHFVVDIVADMKHNKEYLDCEVVTYEVTEKELDRKSLAQVLFLQEV